MNKYKQSIILFGFALPAILFVAVVIACVVVSGGYVSKAKERETAFLQHNSLQTKVTALQRGTKNKREVIESWDKVIQSDIRPVFQTTLKEILDKYSSKQVSQTAYYKPKATGRIALGGAQDSATLNLEFRGSYLPMQMALLELESRLPQLQLNSLSIGRERGNSELEFDLNYTAWEKSE